jgi:hypothetical protein
MLTDTQVSICNPNSATPCTAQALRSYKARAQVPSFQGDASYENVETIFSEYNANKHVVAPGVRIGQLSKYVSRAREWVVQNGAPRFLAVGCSVPCQSRKVSLHGYTFLPVG